MFNKFGNSGVYTLNSIKQPTCHVNRLATWLNTEGGWWRKSGTQLRTRSVGLVAKSEAWGSIPSALLEE
jgi:hypothetical protein